MIRRESSTGAALRALVWLLALSSSLVSCDGSNDGDAETCEGGARRCHLSRFVQRCEAGRWHDEQDCAASGGFCRLEQGEPLCTDGGDSDTDTDTDTDTDSDTDTDPAPITSVSVTASPNSALSALVDVTTSATCRVSVEFGPDTGYGLETGRSQAGLQHHIQVVNMRAESTYHLRVAAKCGDAPVVLGGDRLFTTGALPEGIPDFQVVGGDPSKMQPGVTVFGIVPVGHQQQPDHPAFVAVDREGEVVWYYLEQGKFGRVTNRIEMLPDGNLLVPGETGDLVIDIGGETILQVEYWNALDNFHHDLIRLPNGRFMCLCQEDRVVTVPWNPDPIVARTDRIVEFDATSTLTWSWSVLDHIHAADLAVGEEVSPDPDGSYNLTHANSVWYTENDNSVIVSLRAQHWVIKIDRSTSELVWVLGYQHDDFEMIGQEQSEERLWFVAQHSAERLPDGQLLLFDNGSTPLDLWPELFSRAARYRIDGATKQAELVWEHRLDIVQGGYGDADLLDNGNVLICAAWAPSLGTDLPARIIEVTGDAPSQEVWRLEFHGYTAYRAARWPSFWPNAE